MKIYELNKQYNYDNLQNIWASIGGEQTTFSEFKTVDDFDLDNWTVLAPDIESTNPLVIGDVTLLHSGWDGDKLLQVTNPTWGDIAKFMDNNNDGHHLFVETIEYDDSNKTLRIWCGS